VDLCGHATLASAHVLWEDGHLEASVPACFETRSGRLEARKIHMGIQMDFPADESIEAMAPEALVRAVGTAPMYTGKGKVGFLFEYRSEAEVLALAPDFRAMARASERPVIATARGTSGKGDFISRFFAPTLGVDEDPVTGAAHCCLAPHWEKRLGRKGLLGYQASARGGEMRVLVEGERVFLTGQAVTVMRGELIA
jgi:PhzF family phenazine biosynthesis protein